MSPTSDFKARAHRVSNHPAWRASASTNLSPMSKPTAPAKIAPTASVATTGAATLLTLFAAAESRGQIITNDALNLPSITIDLNRDSHTNWNIDGGGSAEVQFTVTSYNFNLYIKQVFNSFVRAQ